MKKINHLFSTYLFCLCSAQAVVFELDFTGGTALYNENSASLQINSSDVVTGAGAPLLDVRIESLTTYTPDSAAKGADIGAGGNNGTVGDDIKIHMDLGTTTRFRLSLFNAGTTTLYNPGTEYSFSIVIYDIDGDATKTGGADVVTFHSPMTYVITADSTVFVDTTDPSAIKFTGTGGEILGQAGLTSFTPEQENASLQIEISNSSSFEFSYGAANTSGGSGRNMLLDAQNLQVTGAPITFVPVPESSHVALIAGCIGLMSVVLRRKSR
jgi:hypothetical protein